MDCDRVGRFLSDFWLRSSLNWGNPGDGGHRIGAPPALSSAEMRSSRFKLKKFAEGHADDVMMKMHTLVHGFRRRKKPFDLDRAVKKLAGKLQQDITQYRRCQELGLSDRSKSDGQCLKKSQGHWASGLGAPLWQRNLPSG